MIRLCLGIHNHQPVGNFDSVFRLATDNCYLPFLKLVRHYPQIKVTLHNSGVLWDWLKKHQPEYYDLCEQLLEAGQLELLSGGYYEPILPAISDEHKREQIDKLTFFLRRRFKVIPKGMWTAERVWEPYLASVIADCGLEYTILDDTHFLCAGLKSEMLNGYFITEDQNKRIAVFPISKKLRYAIPFKPVGEVIDLLRRMADAAPGKLAIYADDGEKFGIWPDTYKLCYEQGWLADFFEAISKNADWIRVVFFGQALREVAPNGRIYLPAASYAEMGQWSLPAEGYREYEELHHWLKREGFLETHGYLLHGGIWRNFMVKYPEANNMRQKMYRVANKIEAVAQKNRRQVKKLAQAKDLLLQAQCNCPYWHGVFGGLYLNHLRHATYSRLLQAESITDQLGGIPKTGQIEECDFDGDGLSELLVETPLINAYFAPHWGGALFELDLKTKHLNLLDTLARRPEGYHDKLNNLQDKTQATGKTIHERIEAKEKDLWRYLIYDRHRRVSFVDHIMPSATAIDDFITGKHDEWGDFLLGAYLFSTAKTKQGIQVNFWRTGQIGPTAPQSSLRLSKNFFLPTGRAELCADYLLENLGESALSFLLGIELNWALQSGNSNDRYYLFFGGDVEDRHLSSRGELAEVSHFAIADESRRLKIDVSVSVPCRLWRFPIETVSLSESGFERSFQSALTCLCFPISLRPREKHSLQVAISCVDFR